MATIALPPGIMKTIKNAAQDWEHDSPSHTEYQGASGPDDNIGEAADVWINTTRSAPSVHWRTRDTWKLWPGLPCMTRNNRWMHTAHPIDRTLFLWMRKTGSVWLVKKAISKDISERFLVVQFGLPIPAAEFVTDFLESNTSQEEKEKETPIKKKRKRAQNSFVRADGGENDKRQRSGDGELEPERDDAPGAAGVRCVYSTYIHLS